jgi:glutathione S-transferase
MLELVDWKIKGYSEFPRILLNYLGLQYVERNPESYKEWFEEEKINLQTPFPNLPYLKDEDFIVTESNAISYYLVCKSGRKDLFGITLQEQTLVMSTTEVLAEMLQAIFKFINHPDCKTEYTNVFSENGLIGAKIQQISKLLGDKEWILGYITLADLKIFSALDWIIVIAFSSGAPCPVWKHENIVGLMNRVAGLPGIKEFLETRKNVLYMPEGSTRLQILTKAEINEKILQCLEAEDQ